MRLPKRKTTLTTLAWAAGLAVLGIVALALFLYAPDKPRAALEAAYPGEYLRHLPHATLVRLPNLGHLPFEEDPATSLSPVERFLSGETP